MLIHLIERFHNLMLGIWLDLMIWFHQEGWWPQQWSEVELKINDNMLADKYRKKELELLLKNFDVFSKFIPANMVEEWKVFAGMLKKVYFHEGGVEAVDFFVAKKNFFLKYEPIHKPFLNKPNWHNMDHVVLQVPQTGPVPTKKENIGETIHATIKKMNLTNL